MFPMLVRLTREAAWLRLAPSLLLLSASRLLVAQPAEVWRYFTSNQGLVESWVGAVSTTTNGRVLITHGQVPDMSTFDGFSMGRMPSPGSDARVEEGAAGEFWAVEKLVAGTATGIKLLHDGKWTSFPVADFAAPDPELLVTASGAQQFLPFAKGRVLYLTRDGGIRWFNAATGQSMPVSLAGCELGVLHSLARSAASGFWIAGEKGIGRIRGWPSDTDSLDCVPWVRQRSSGLTHFSNLFEDGASVFASARQSQGGRVLIRADGTSLVVLARTTWNQARICGWGANGGAAWILREDGDEQRLSFRSPSGAQEPGPKSKLLSGRIADVAVQPNGVFWLATSLGLARYAPPVWQTFGPPPVATGQISSIAQAPSGDLFFLSANSLWILSGGRWLERRLPANLLTNVALPKSMAVLRNGNVAIPARISRDVRALLVYSPIHDRFETPAIAGLSNCMFVAARSLGRVWAACRDAAGKVSVLSYDGGRFERVFEIPPDPDHDWPRSITEFSDGSIWVGSFWRDCLYRYANRVLVPITLPPEAAAMGVADLIEQPGGKLWLVGRNRLMERNGSSWRVLERNLETGRALCPARDGSIWIAAGAGIMRCQDNSCVSFGIDDGMPESAAWTVFEDSTGRILAGTASGVRFRAADADPDPPFVDVPAELNVSRFAPGGVVRLVARGKDRWRFTPDSRLLFSFRSDGAPWSPFDELTVISLEGVASGHHTLEVRAMDRNFNVSRSALYRFEVLTPWYRRPDALLFSLVVFCIITFSIYVHVNRHRELARLVQLKTAQLATDFEEKSRLRARFESILDHAPVLIYVRDLQGRYIAVNRRYLEAIGKTREELVGKTDLEVFGPSVPPPFQANDARVIAENKAIQFEETVRHAGVAKVYLSIKCPLYDAAEMPNAVCGISTDVTESKALQERLDHSQRLESIGRLAGGIAHDFNNLLTVICGYANLLAPRLAADPESQEEAALILKAGERAAALTSQLLAFGRRQLMQPRVIDVRPVVSEMCEILRRMVPSNIQFHVSCDDAPAVIRVDPAQMQQVVMNLVLNARDAMPTGGDLYASVTNLIQAPQHLTWVKGPCVRLRITDTGIGMDAETRARAFEPFYTTKPLGKGTGLGMATVYGIVRQSEGEIEVSSAPLHGTTIDIYLPRVASQPDEPPVASAPLASPGKGRVLVVEDQPQVRDLVTEVLTADGYQVQNACNSAQALASEGPFDLLISDIVMPGMPGPELAARLKATFPELRVILMSGYADSRTEFLEHGAQFAAFLQKPFSPATLLHKVKETLGVPLHNTP